MIEENKIFDDETKRRERGAFYTPEVYALKADKICQEHLGQDYKNTYTVWDCCCGSKSLTRNHTYKNLYCSTIEPNEIEEFKSFNEEATSFVFDFLDGPLDELPKNLLDDLKSNKPLLFKINPPYVAGASITKTATGLVKRSEQFNKEKKEAGFTGSSSNLYLQFLERICYIKMHFNLDNVKILLFSPLPFITGVKQKKFRDTFLKYFGFQDGYYFNAGEFSGVSAIWDISLTFWGEPNDLRNRFHYKHLVRENDGLKIDLEKNFCNTDGLRSWKDWLKESDPKGPKREAPSFSSGLKNGSYKNAASGLIDNTYGYMFDTRSSTNGTVIFSSGFSNSHGKYIDEDNVEKCASTLVAMNLTSRKDAVLYPEENDYASKMKDGSLGFLIEHPSSCSRETAIFAAGFTDDGGKYITEDNVEKCTATLTMRRTTDKKDAVLYPEENDRASKLKDGSLGYMLDCPTSQDNTSAGVIFSAGFSDSHGRYIDKKNIEKVAATNVVRNNQEEKDAVVAPEEANFTSSLKDGSIGYLVDNPGSKSIHTTIMDTAFTGHVGKYITENNTEKCAATLTLRSVTDNNDAVIAPEEDYKLFNFMKDSVIFAIFDNRNNATSLRGVYFLPKDESNVVKSPNVKYVGNGWWDIFNPWYPLATPDKENGNSFIYEWLLENEKCISPVAKEVLDYGRILFKEAEKYKEAFDKDHKNYQIMNYDCGWYQIKEVVKIYMPEEWKKFNNLFEKFKEFMAKKVDDLGFVLK